MLKLTITLLAIMLCMTSCSDNGDDGDELIHSNAEGILVFYNTNEVMKEVRYYWIDNYTLKFTHIESYIEKL